jgi:hypothetical protein
MILSENMAVVNKSKRFWNQLLTINKRDCGIPLFLVATSDKFGWKKRQILAALGMTDFCLRRLG